VTTRRRQAALVGAALLLALPVRAAERPTVTWHPAKPRLGEVSWVHVQGAGDATTIELGGEIHYTDGFNANGIAFARGWLLIVQSNLGLVFKVDSESGEATQIELSDAAGDYTVVNGDGIEVRGNSLAVVRNFNNEVDTFKLNGQLTAGVLTDQIESSGFAIPTTATWAAGDLWAVNARFDVQNPPPDLPYWITRVPGL